MAKDKKKSFEEKWGSILINPTEIASLHGFWSTGSPAVDALLGGGLHKGSMSEFYGKPQSGKSTLALSTARQVIRQGGRVLYIDLERGLDIREGHQRSWLEVNGIDPFDTYHFAVVQDRPNQPLAAEDIYELIIDAMEQNKYQYIVLDSMAGMTTRSELAGEIGESHFGAVAKVNSQALKILFRKFGSNRETHITFINQVRDQIAGGMGGLKSTGGRALEHYVGLKLRLDRGRRVEAKDGDVATPVFVKVDKSRYGAAKKVEIRISSDRGIDVLQEVQDFAILNGYIHQSGAWYTLFDRPVEPTVVKNAKKNEEIEGFLFKSQGDTGLKAYLQESGWFDTLYGHAVGAAVVEDDNEDE